MEHKFRVELLVKTQLQREAILVKEVIAAAEEDAVKRAIHLLEKEFSMAGWVKIDPWHVEKIT